MSKVMVTLQDLGILASTAERNGTQDAFVEVALQWAGEANATIARLTAELKTCRGDDCGEMASLKMSYGQLLASNVRLTAERDAALAEVDQLCQAVAWLLEPEPSRASRVGARRILDAARKGNA